MAGYFINVLKSANKSLAKIPLSKSLRIKQTIDRLVLEPYLGDKMQGKYGNQRKIRVWPYRIIYMILEKERVIKIMEVERRGSVSYD